MLGWKVAPKNHVIERGTQRRVGPGREWVKDKERFSMEEEDWNLKTTEEEKRGSTYWYIVYIVGGENPSQPTKNNGGGVVSGGGLLAHVGGGKWCTHRP